MALWAVSLFVISGVPLASLSPLPGALRVAGPAIPSFPVEQVLRREWVAPHAVGLTGVLISGPALLNHVGGVLGRGAGKDVVRSDARADVTGVATLKLRRDGTPGDLAGNQVRPVLPTPDLELSVPAVEDGSPPEPAPIRLLDVAPEALNIGRSQMHGSNIGPPFGLCAVR